MKILIKNGLVVDMVSEQPDVKDILIENDKIKMIKENIEEKADKVIDATGKAVMPGLINCHHHCAMSFFKGYADDLELQEWLEKAIWPVEEKMTVEDVYYSAYLACIEMIKSGTTTFCDMYFNVDGIANAVKETGIRAHIGRTIIFDDVESDIRLKEAEDLFKKYNNSADNRIKVNLPIHSVYTCNKETIKKCVDLANKYQMKIHIHLSETQKENEQIKREYNMTPTQLLKQLGVLKSECILAHGVYLTDIDLNIIKKSGSGIVHNPISNMKLASGIADIIKMKEYNIPVALGTDGSGSTTTLDMFEQMKVSSLLQKVYHKKSSIIRAQDVIKMSTINGAKLLDEKEIGTLEIGKKADIIIINLNKPHIQPLNNIYSALVYSVNGQDVDTTIINGKIIMENRKLLNIDEQKIINKNKEIAKKYFGK